eukprot:3694896-Prymnesium_polylepis.1
MSSATHSTLDDPRCAASPDDTAVASTVLATTCATTARTTTCATALTVSSTTPAAESSKLVFRFPALDTHDKVACTVRCDDCGEAMCGPAEHAGFDSCDWCERSFCSTCSWDNEFDCIGFD